jgi:hypothetical protein
VARAPRAPLGRALRGSLRALALLGIVCLFLTGFTAALVGHLNLAAGRRATATIVGRSLAGLFRGQVSIGSISRVSPSEVTAQDIVVRDPAHRVVLKVNRLTAQADVLDIARRLLRGDEKLTIVINHVRIERAEAEVIPGDDGLPTLAHAFLLRPDEADADPAPPSAQYVRVWLPAVEIGKIFARGSVSGSPTLETELQGVRGSVLATPKGAAIDVARFALLARGVGGADAKGVASLHIRAPGAVWGNFDGYMGDVQFGSVVRWENEALDLRANLPRAEPQAARALLSSWPLLVSTEAQLHLKGRPPELEVELRAKLGEAASLTSTGTINFATPLRLNLDIEGRSLDLRALWADAPRTSIDVDTSFGMHQEQGQWAFELGGSSRPTSVQSVVVPGADFTATTKDGAFVGEAKLHDVGLPLDLSFSVFPNGKLAIDAEARRVSLASVERIKPYFDGTGNADLRLHAELFQNRLDSSFELDVRGLSYQGATLQTGRLLASVKGSLAAPGQLLLNARLNGKRLSYGRFAFEALSGTAHGPVLSPLVTVALQDPTGPSLDGRARLVVENPVSVRELTLGVARDGVEIRGEVAQLDIADERVLIRDLRLHGATGELSGNAELTPKALSVTASGQNLDLSAISRVMGLPRGVLEGRASVAIDAMTSGKTQRGTLELSIDKASIENVNGISGQLSAKLDGPKLSGASTGRIEGLGTFSADWDTELGGPPTERASFERATGRATASLTDVTLDYLGQLWPEQDLDVAGRATMSLELSRHAPDAVPNLRFSGATQGLLVTVARQEQPPLVFSGIELVASAEHDGATGNTNVALGAQQGTDRLLGVSSDLTLDLAAAVSEREPLERQLKTRPLLAKIVVSRLDLDNLPGALRLPGMRGLVRLEGTVRGTLSEPIASLGVRASDLRFTLSDRAEPIDVCATAEYAQRTGDFNVGAELFLPAGLDLRAAPCSGRRVANLRLTGQAPFDFEQGLLPWRGSAIALLEGLPLATLPPLAEARLTGTATGKLLVDRSTDSPNASAELELSGVRMDRLTIGDGKLELRSNATRAKAKFGIQHGATTVSGEVNAGISWSEALPALDDAQPIDTSIQARRLEASVLEPLLTDFVTELQGRVDGDVSARLEALAPGEQARRLEQVSGSVSLANGAFVLTGLGFRLREVSFTATAERGNQQTRVKIPELKASAGAKSENMRADVVLHLKGLGIEAGQAGVTIVQLPLVVDGITRAHADAVFTLNMTRHPEKMHVKVDFQSLDAQLPPDSPRELVKLDENENVKLLQPIAEPKGQRAEDDLPWQFEIHLGQHARVARGVLLDLPIAGDPNVVLARGLGVTGAIYLQRRGAVQMLGKIFVIEQGGVFFDTPDPKDPRLDVQASWRAPDGQTLTAFVTGTLSAPILKFDRPNEDAWSMLLDQGVATLGIGALDTLLSDTPLARVQLRGQDNEQGTTYSAAYRVNNQVIVEGNYQAPSSSVSDDASGNVGAAVDWRFAPRWSVRGQLGTIGTGVDLVYQYRY